jgi:lipopolysaccharide export LptBFGC system permease protein LptF
MIVSLARQDLDPAVGRQVVMAILLLGLGVLHLVLRRHVRRAAVAFAALGLGLQVLDGAARGSELAGSAPPTPAIWLATAITVALVVKLGRARERFAGGPWVSDAHDLHD